MTHDERQFFLQLRVCPICKREKLHGEEKSCPECRAKATNASLRYYEAHKASCILTTCKCRDRRHQKRKELGLCVYCGRQARADKVSCMACAEKKRMKTQRFRAEVNAI